ncbi:MAG: hypothetical protein HY914_19105 [Desulfomonile tiedjei]|nr:hypothetical protein [Desulfomonile tiedjei]
MASRILDDLIRTAWDVIDSDFDPRAIYRWRKQAIEFLDDHLGPNHYYTQCFRQNIEETEQKNLLTASGILHAVKEEMSQTRSLGDGISQWSAMQ